MAMSWACLLSLQGAFGSLVFGFFASVFGLASTFAGA
jgi:hypothetical protein